MGAALKEMVSTPLYTYEDYYSWDDDVRCELIDGVVYNMGAPTVWHQDVAGEIFGQLREFLKGKKCRAYISPIDVRLKADKRLMMDDTVVQPDVIVLCDKSKIDEGKSIKGAPDLVIEVISPSSIKKDKLLKFNQYKNAGVREYWVVDARSFCVDVYYFNEGTHNVFQMDEMIPVRLLEGCEIDLSEFVPEGFFELIISKEIIVE